MIPNSFSFGVERRLHTPNEFSGVFSSRQVVRGGLNSPFILHFRLLGNQSLPRLGVVVPKRLVKKAFLRNAVKRQGREAFRLFANELPSCDLILRVHRPLGSVKHPACKDWRLLIDDLLKRLVAQQP